MHIGRMQALLGVAQLLEGCDLAVGLGSAVPADIYEWMSVPSAANLTFFKIP